jgi:hypothetical protein
MPRWIKIESTKEKNLKFALAAVPTLLAMALGCAAPVLADQPRREPYSCRLLYDEQKKCAFGSCDKRTVGRLRNECLRDGGRP